MLTFRVLEEISIRLARAEATASLLASFDGEGIELDVAIITEVAAGLREDIEAVRALLTELLRGDSPGLGQAQH